MSIVGDTTLLSCFSHRVLIVKGTAFCNEKEICVYGRRGPTYFPWEETVSLSNRKTEILRKVEVLQLYIFFHNFRYFRPVSQNLDPILKTSKFPELFRTKKVSLPRDGSQVRGTINTVLSFVIKSPRT